MVSLFHNSTPLVSILRHGTKNIRTPCSKATLGEKVVEDAGLSISSYPPRTFIHPEAVRGEEDEEAI